MVRLHFVLNLLKRLLLLQVQASDSGLMVTPNIIRGFQLRVSGSRHDKALTDEVQGKFTSSQLGSILWQSWH